MVEGFQVSGFRFQVSGFRFLVGFRILDADFRDLRFQNFRVSGFKGLKV